MSKYRKIQVTITNPAHLLSALDDLGLRYDAGNPYRNDAILTTHWKRYDGHDQPVAVAIQREYLNAKNLYAMDGIGFAWNGEGYDLICDGSDENGAVVNQIKQRYAVNAAKSAALEAGYLIDEVTEPDGTVRLVCSAY